MKTKIPELRKAYKISQEELDKFSIEGLSG